MDPREDASAETLRALHSLAYEVQILRIDLEDHILAVHQEVWWLRAVLTYLAGSFAVGLAWFYFPPVFQHSVEAFADELVAASCLLFLLHWQIH